VTRRFVRLVSTGSFLLGLLGLVAGSGYAAGERTVLVLPTTGTVDNVMAGYIHDGIARAEREGDAAIVIRLNTPGGSLDATNDIVGSLLEANVPTIVWVAPSGGRAASAGTFITLAAHLALMAPGTNIGAASPVGGGGEDIPGTLGEKVKNDAIAKIRSIALERGRNVDWAVSTVRDAASSPATEAVQQHAVDGLARTLDDVLAFADGKTITVAGAQERLSLAGASTVELAMNPLQAFLHLLSDGNIAAMLFTVGSLGLVYELISPNFVTGIIGALAIILAFIGFGSLPLNVGGLLLIGLAMLLFALEATVVSHGLLTVGGLICFALGVSALYTEPSSPFAPDVSVALPLIVTMTLTIGAFMAIALLTVMRSRRRIPALAAMGFGAGGTSRIPAGTAGEVRMPLAPVGSVYAAGEEWTARAVADRFVERGVPVRVVREEGLTLIVEPAGPVGARP
jgi:membrane-bound serine protease (ClpP class)